MLPVSQSWKDLQGLQLRPEADVKIEFYAGGYVSGDPVATVNKDNISSFNYKVSGKVDNVNVPSKTINLELIKGNHDDVEKGYNAILYFGFLINGTWEYVEADYFKVTEVTIPANGLVDKFVLRPISGEAFEQSYKKGSNGGNVDPRVLIGLITGYPYNALLPVQYSAYTDIQHLEGVLLGMSLGQCSKIEALQLLGIACGRTLVIKKSGWHIYQDASYPTGSVSDIGFKNITPDTTDMTDYVINPNNSYQFPELKTSKKIGNLIVTQYTNVQPTDGQGDPIKAHTYNEVFTSIQSRSWDKQFNELYYKITYSTKAGSFSPNSLFTGARLDGYVARWWALPLSAPSRMEVYIWAMETTAEQKEYTINSGSDTEDFSVDNPLVNANYITPCSDYLRAWLPYQNYIECDFRIDPRIELFDKIVIVDKDGNSYFTVVEEYTITFNGGFNGKLTGRVISKATIQPVTINNYGDDDFDIVSIHNPNSYAVTIEIHISTGTVQTYTIQANGDKTVWADSDNRPMQAERGRMINGTLTQDCYAVTKMASAPTVVAQQTTTIYVAMKDPIITNNTYDGNGNFSITIQNQNSVAVTLGISYSAGTLTFTIPANSSITLDNSNADELYNSAEEKYWGSLFDTVECYFSYLYPYQEGYGSDGYTQGSNWVIIWEADL